MKRKTLAKFVLEFKDSVVEYIAQQRRSTQAGDLNSKDLEAWVLYDQNLREFARSQGVRILWKGGVFYEK